MRIPTWAVALTLLALSGCAMTSSPTAVKGGDGSQPSALPITAPDPPAPDSLFERFPEMEIQAK
jgi:hypothetical protein